MDIDKVQNKKLKNKIFETVNCNLCGSKEYRVVYPARYGNEKDKDIVEKFRASGDELLVDQLVQCKKCGLIYVSPRLKAEVIVKAYSEGEDPTFVSQAGARENTFSKAMNLIEKYVPKKGAILDIGTAGGSFLAAAKRRGWNVRGCEPNKWLASWGKKTYGVQIDAGTVFDQRYKSKSYDVVTLWDVIEHTPDPLKVLEECNRLLKNRGVLIVNYPDIGSWIARLTGRKWLFLTSVHLFYFTPKTMKAILSKAGFETVLIKPHYQKLELDYLLFRGAAYSPLISKIGRGIVKILRMEKKQVPYWLGQTFVVARKKNDTK